jgi:hypothetical protein
MTLSLAMVKALGLPGTDAPPLLIATHALAIAGYRADPAERPTENHDAAVVYLAGLVTALDALGPTPQHTERQAVVDEIVEAPTDDEVATLIGGLDGYIRPYGGPIAAGNRTMLDIVTRTVASAITDNLE